MTSNIDFLDAVTDMAPMFIKLSDERFVTANKKGTVALGSRLNLQNVLFVDGLQYHLIFVSQLTRDVIVLKIVIIKLVNCLLDIGYFVYAYRLNGAKRRHR